jgi:hypothetical protein
MDERPEVKILARPQASYERAHDFVPEAARENPTRRPTLARAHARPAPQAKKVGEMQAAG